VLDANLIQVQLPIEDAAGDWERSLPEPDLAVLQEIEPDCNERHPRGDELPLAIEVAGTTVAFDLSRKVALYAPAGVREYWVLDLPCRLLVVHCQPFGSAYRPVELSRSSYNINLRGLFICKSEMRAASPLIAGRTSPCHQP